MEPWQVRKRIPRRRLGAEWIAKLQRLQLPRAAEDKLEVAMRPATVAVIGRCEVKAEAAADGVGAGGSGRSQVVVVSGGGDDSPWPLAKGLR
jgi:hypothetical protein